MCEYLCPGGKKIEVAEECRQINIPIFFSCSVFTVISTKKLLFLAVFHCSSDHKLMSVFLKVPFFLLCLCFVADRPPNLPPPILRVLRTLIPVTRERAIHLSGQDPIHSAADGGQVECLRLLIQEGRDVNALLGTHISGVLNSLRGAFKNLINI